MCQMIYCASQRSLERLDPEVPRSLGAYGMGALGVPLVPGYGLRCLRYVFEGSEGIERALQEIRNLLKPPVLVHYRTTRRMVARAHDLQPFPIGQGIWVATVGYAAPVILSSGVTAHLAPRSRAYKVSVALTGLVQELYYPNAAETFVENVARCAKALYGPEIPTWLYVSGVKLRSDDNYALEAETGGAIHYLTDGEFRRAPVLEG